MRLLIIKLCFWLIRQLTPAPHTVLRAKGRRPLQILHVEKSDFSIIGGLPRQRYRVSSKQHESQREWPVRYMNQGMLDGDFWLVRVGDGRWRGKSKWGL